jgi:hypothetical protein
LTGIPEIKLNNINITKLIDIASLVGLFPSARESMVKNYTSSIPFIAGYEGKLFRIFLNLFKNSMDATHGNGIVKIDIFEQNNELIVRVSDNSPGMPKEKVDAFNAGLSVRSSKGEKGGRGLKIVRQMVNDNGGTISVESEVGKGTTFTIRLPIADKLTTNDERQTTKSQPEPSTAGTDLGLPSEPSQIYVSPDETPEIVVRRIAQKLSDQLLPKIDEFQRLIPAEGMASLPEEERQNRLALLKQSIGNIEDTYANTIYKSIEAMEKTAYDDPLNILAHAIRNTIQHTMATLTSTIGRRIFIAQMGNFKDFERIVSEQLEILRNNLNTWSSLPEIRLNMNLQKTHDAEIYTPGGGGLLEALGFYRYRMIAIDGRILIEEVQEAELWNFPSSMVQKTADTNAKSEPLSTATSESEQIHATNFRDALKYLQAEQQAQPVIVAIGTSWITGYAADAGLYRNALNPLISNMANRPQFIVGDDESLLAEIKKKMGESGFENARVIVIAGEETITKDLAKELDNGKNILLGVDNSYLTEDSYVRIMEMLEIAAKLAIDPDTPPESPNMPIEKRGNFWVFVPKAEPMNYELLKPIYEAQRSA